MEGLFYTHREDLTRLPGHPQAEALKLLAKQGPLEIMHQQLVRHATVWLSPSHDAGALEFFYLISGAICLGVSPEGLTLKAGDCFYTSDLKQDVVLTVMEDTELLYVSTTPVFDDSFNFQLKLYNLLQEIDARTIIPCSTPSTSATMP